MKTYKGGIPFLQEKLLPILKQWKLFLYAIPLTAAWLYLWYGPWQARLHHIFWIQLGVSLGIFIVPGLCAYGLLADRPRLEFNHITFGFVLSHLMLSLLGTLGRFMQVSFSSIKFIMMILGLLLLLVYVLPALGSGFRFNFKRNQLATLSSIVPMLLVAFAVGLVVIQRVLNDDDLTYLAYVIHWQHAAHLGFSDFIFGVHQIVQPRFWLMSAPFAQALLANLSQVPGILILGGYYEPVLVIISILCWYELARTLKFSPKAASASVILELSFLVLLSEYLHPGAPFFNQLSADKATASFIFAPVFFQSLIRLLEKTTHNNMLLFLLVGISLTLMHPVALAYSVAIAGLLILLNGNIWDLRRELVPVTILIIILMPQILLRFAKVPAMEQIPYGPEAALSQNGIQDMIAQWGHTSFYGFNLNILAMNIPYSKNIPLSQPVLKWGWILIPILSTIYAFKHRDDLAAQLILSGFLLCFLAWFPLTGWIIGYFLSAWMLERAVWLFPFGISTVYLLVMLGNLLRNTSDFKNTSISISGWSLGTITIISLSIFFLYMRENKLPDFAQFNLKSIRYADLATAGQTLDQLISDRTVVLGSQGLNDLIPGISWKSQLVTFRIQDPSNMVYFTSTERATRISDTQKIFLRSTPADEQMSLLGKYNVHFLLLQRNDIKLFDDLITEHPNQITATEVGGVYIVQIH